MSDFLSVQDILDLIGDLGNYAGLPGSVVGGYVAGTPPVPQTTSAQHPIYPLQATLQTNNTSGAVSIGGPGQRCILPSADGNSNLVMNILGPTKLPIPANKFNVPRCDYIVGQAITNAGASGLPARGATFQHARGPDDSSNPPTYDPGFAPVVQITVPPSGQPWPSNAAQIILPSLTFVSLPASGSFASAALSGALIGSATPLTAAVVTAPPFNAPCIVGGAQGFIQPTLDAMPAIQAALDAVGPGGAIYIPSGTYGYKSTATTQAGALSDPFGGSAGKLVGQTIIFGGAVSFVALADVPAFFFNDRTTTIGTPRFFDTIFSAMAPNGNTYGLNGFGSYTVSGFPTTGSNAFNYIPQAGQWALLFDGDGNQIFGQVTAATATSITVHTAPPTGSLLDAVVPTVTTVPASGMFTVPVSGALGNLFLGAPLYITGFSGLTQEWVTGVLTALPTNTAATTGTIEMYTTAQSPTVGMPANSKIFLQNAVPSTMSGNLGSSDNNGAITVRGGVTGNSFAVQITGNALTIDGIYVEDCANGVLIGSSGVSGPGSTLSAGGVWPPYLASGGLGESEIGSIRAKGVIGTGIQISSVLPGANASNVHDSFIKSLYAVTGAGGVCGVDFNGQFSTQQASFNSLKISHIECLGFQGSYGPPVNTIPPEGTVISSTGICMRGSKVQAILVGIAFTSSCGTGLYLDAGIETIDFNALNAGGQGSTNTPGYCFLSNGASGLPVSNVRVGMLKCSGRPPMDNAAGIYLGQTQDFHADYAFVEKTGGVGVLIVNQSSSIGFDHLILSSIGGPYGISDNGDSSSSSISIDKLDAFQALASIGAVFLSAAQHVSYNDLGIDKGYYSSDLFTAGLPGDNLPRAFNIGNTSPASGVVQITSIGTGDSSFALNGVTPVIAGVWDLDAGATPATPVAAIDQLGDLAIGGFLALATTGSIACVISAGYGLPSATTPGAGQNGSLYLRLDPVNNQHLYVYNLAPPDPFGWLPIG